MALIIISADTQAKTAREKLRLAIDDDVTVNLVVYGTGATVDRIVEVAMARAQLRPLIRSVVWVQDPSLLSAKQRAKYYEPDKAAVAIDLRDEPCVWLVSADAIDRFEIESAFTKAESTAGQS